MMTIPLTRHSQDGVSFSIVERNGVDHIFATSLPRMGKTLSEQTQSALEAVMNVLNNFDAAESILHLSVFLSDINQIATCRRIVSHILGDQVPATSYVPQPPCQGALVAIEVLALGMGHEIVEIQRVDDHLLLTHQDGRTWVYADQVEPRTSAPGVYERTLCSYQQLRRLLPQGNARLDQVVRTWLYLGGIVEDEGPTQRYKELNRARADVYEGVDFLAERLPNDPGKDVFPASTGIGTEGRDVQMSAMALLSDRDDVVAVPLENPRQTAAFAYSAHYSPQSPKFSRGMAVAEGKATMMFISGTASITHSETQHVGDVVGQTHETLDNIAALIGEENLAQHGLPGRGATLETMGVARVYIKNREDYPAVRAVCEKRLRGVPLTYVVADVCRTDLLVEIEGVAFSQMGKGTREQPLIRRGIEESKVGKCQCACPTSCPERTTCPFVFEG
jgi:enamine deaminase RidA (YjgF/YER057c/UK114 family)